MSVFRRKGSPYYYAEFEIFTHRFLRSTKKTTEREARAEERRLKAIERKKLEEEKVRKPGEPMSLSQAFGKYWTDHAPKLAATWRSEVQRYCDHILKLIDGGQLIEEITESEVDEFVQEHNLAGGGRYALNRALSVWRRVHRLSRKRWKQKTHEIDWAEFFNSESKRTNHLTMDKARRLIEVSDQDMRWMIEWSLLAGTRRSETFNLSREQISLEEGKATVIAKGGKEHTVWLTPDALSLLARIPHRGRYVFDTTNWRKRWEAAVEAAAIQGTRWHDLRHTHATWLRQSGAPLEVVQRSLGHGDLQTTLRYAHVEDSELREALRKLPSVSTITPKVVSIKSAKSAS